MATKTQSAYKNETTTLTANTFTRSGYDFLGWNTDMNATTALYADKAQVSFSKDTQLYAIWTLSTIRTITPSVWTPSGHSITGSRRSDSANSSPIYAWTFGGHAYTNSSGKADAYYTTNQNESWHSIFNIFDSTSDLIAARTIKYNKSLGGIGSQYDGVTVTESKTCGVGGTCINTLTLSGKNCLISKIDVCPYISCAIESGLPTSSYKSGLITYNWWWWDTESDTALVFTSSNQQSVFSRGQCFRVTMTIAKPDGSEVSMTKDVTDTDTKSTYGWTTYSASAHKNHYITFDFADDILQASLPVGSYTKSIVFREGTSFTALKNMATHGIRLYSTPNK